MNRYQLIQIMTMTALAWEAVSGGVAAVHCSFGSVFEMIFQLSPVIVIFGLLLWKIWKKPRKWGLGIGIFYTFAIGMRTYFWFAAMAKYPAEVAKILYPAFGLAMLLLPAIMIAVGCWLLRYLGDEKGAETPPPQPA
jgi:hypothetical protein